MKRLFIFAILLTVIFSGCGGVRTKYVLVESEKYYFIPAGVSFNAVIQKGQPPVEVTRTLPSWVVDAGYLIKLQEAANEIVLGIPE